MRKRTCCLIVASTAIASAVSSFNNFIPVKFGLLDEAIVFGGFYAVFILLNLLKMNQICSLVQNSLLFRSLMWSAAIVFGWSATVNLSYSIQIFAMPLQDDIFLAADKFLGFDYISLMSWMSRHRGISDALNEVYMLFPPLIIFISLSDIFFANNDNRGEKFYTSALIAFLLAFAICALLPAAGAASLLDPETATLATGATPLDRLYALRSGDAYQFSRGATGGLVSFPSMHVAIAVLALHATRRLRWLFLSVLPICVGFCITALTHGGHYLVDCFAGVVVAFAAIKINQYLHYFEPYFFLNVFAKYPKNLMEEVENTVTAFESTSQSRP